MIAYGKKEKESDQEESDQESSEEESQEKSSQESQEKSQKEKEVVEKDAAARFAAGSLTPQINGKRNLATNQVERKVRQEQKDATERYKWQALV